MKSVQTAGRAMGVMALVVAAGMPVAQAHEGHAAGIAAADSFIDYGTVRSVVPEYRRVITPRQQCYNEYAPAAAVSQPGLTNPTGAMIVGGIVGGLAGHQVGGGSGKTAATVAGTLAGAYLGGQLAGANGAAGPAYGAQPVQRCTTVEEAREELAGYRVSYTYRGRTFSALTRQHPGQRLPLRISVAPEID